MEIICLWFVVLVGGLTVMTWLGFNLAEWALSHPRFIVVILMLLMCRLCTG